MDTSYPSPVKTWLTQGNSIRLGTLPIMVIMATPVVFLAWLVFKPWGHQGLLWFDDGLLFISALGATLAAMFAAVRYRGTRRGLAWMFICLGMASTAFGEGAWGFQEAILGREVNSPAVADIGYLGLYPAAFIGLFLLPAAPVTGLRRLRLGLDLLVAVGALSVISFHFVVENLIQAAGELTLGDTIIISYPILDVALVFATLAIFVRAANSVTKMELGLLTAGFAAIGLSDSIFIYVNEVGSYYSGALFDMGWLIGYLLIATAALVTAGRELNLATNNDDPSRPVPFWQTTLLHGLLVPVCAMLFLKPENSAFRVDVIVLIGFVALMFVTLLRQIVAYFDHVLVYRQVQELAEALKFKVQEQRIQEITRPPHARNDDPMPRTFGRSA